MKVFLPTGTAAGASLVFDTRSRFTETDRLTLQRIVPHLAQLRRNALARRTYPALIDSTASARIKLLRLTPRERVVLARAAAGETTPGQVTSHPLPGGFHVVIGCPGMAKSPPSAGCGTGVPTGFAW